MGSLKANEKKLERRYENDIENSFQSKIKMQSQKSKKSGRKFKGEKHIDNNSEYPPCGICKRKSHLEKDCWFK